MNLFVSLAIASTLRGTHLFPAASSSFSVAAPIHVAAPVRSRTTQFHGTIGYPAEITWVWVSATGSPGTEYQTFIRRPGGGPLRPTGCGGSIAAGGEMVCAFGTGGESQLPVARVEVWSIATGPIDIRMHFQ